MSTDLLTVEGLLTKPQAQLRLKLPDRLCVWQGRRKVWQIQYQDRANLGLSQLLALNCWWKSVSCGLDSSVVQPLRVTCVTLAGKHC
jgi:hypothetical protein